MRGGCGKGESNLFPHLHAADRQGDGRFNPPLIRHPLGKQPGFQFLHRMANQFGMRGQKITPFAQRRRKFFRDCGYGGGVEIDEHIAAQDKIHVMQFQSGIRFRSRKRLADEIGNAERHHAADALIQ